MKKVTMTFVVSDSIADDVQNEMTWGEMGNAARILNANCAMQSLRLLKTFTTTDLEEL